MLYFLFLLLIVLSLCFPKSKAVYFAIGLFMIISIGLRTGGTDYFYYYNEFESATTIPASLADFPFYNIWMNFLIKRGVETFPTYILIMAILCVTFTLIGIFNLSKYVGPYVSFSLGLYLIYPFGHESGQLRTFVVDTIILCALPFLLKRANSRKQQVVYYLIYFGSIYIASGIHSLAYFYIIIGIAYIILKIMNRYRVLTVFIMTFLACILVKGPGISSFTMSLLNTNKQDHWLEGQASFLSSSFGIVLTLILWILLRKLTDFTISNASLESQRIFLENLKIFVTLSLLMIPLFMYDITFNRLWRIYLIILYLLTGNYLYVSGKIGIKKILFLIVIIILIFSLFMYEHEYTIISLLFHNNALFE